MPERTELPAQIVADLKRRAAESAVCYIESGMVVGLGSGTTAAFAVRRLGQLVRSGRLQRIVGIPTSREVAALARDQGIPLGTLEDHSVVDVTIDGADEIDPDLNLIKGRGGAMLHERIVAHASRCFLIVADERKLVRCLGTRVPLPVEVVPFGWTLAARKLAALGAKVERRLLGVEAVLTDEGNYLLDCHFGVIRDPVGLERAVQAIPGVVSHGLFLDMATMVIVGAREGLRLVRRSDAVRTRDASHTREAAKPE